jgi:hypothetical protein
LIIITNKNELKRRMKNKKIEIFDEANFEKDLSTKTSKYLLKTAYCKFKAGIVNIN